MSKSASAGILLGVTRPSPRPVLPFSALMSHSNRSLFVNMQMCLYYIVCITARVKRGIAGTATPLSRATSSCKNDPRIRPTQESAPACRESACQGVLLFFGCFYSIEKLSRSRRKPSRSTMSTCHSPRHSSRTFFLLHVRQRLLLTSSGTWPMLRSPQYQT